MKAMILAAGLGTRLKPLTDTKPKALLQAGPYTLLEFAVKKLNTHGFHDILINVHHLADQVVEYVQANNYFGCSISFSDERDKLLDTGGGILKAAEFFYDDQPFMVYNADIVCNTDLAEVYRFHKQAGNLATLVVRIRQSSRYLLFDEDLQLTEWSYPGKGLRKIVRMSEGTPKPYAFSGIHVIEPEIFPLLRALPYNDVFSITDAYLELAKSRRIGAYPDESSLYIDAGKPDSLVQAGIIASQILMP